MECAKPREKLPNFPLKGSERDAPFLVFLTLLSQCSNLIINYDEKMRAKLLYEHLDDFLIDSKRC